MSSVHRIVDVTEGIARKAAEIRRLWKARTGKNLKLPDAVIAATAVSYNASLVGNNDKDFAPLREMIGLDYQNPIQSQEELRKFLSQEDS
ncbi:PIN domain-containing protein [Alicyclobacillus cycloheptanicus]|uniref:PIN domain-containing protein n=1 Tax=Alicyclobacillus cycloheptanicus TaxID=1457 RepID=UPI003898DD79